MQSIQLQDYSIHLGTVWSVWNEFLETTSYSKIIVIADENTAIHCFPIFKAHTLKAGLHLLEIKAGEQHKIIETCQQIWASMMEMNTDRKALVVNLGGGVIGDMGGFCASTFKRGIDFVQFPTTLLSQVDASIGGKLGIDFKEVKNSIGVFNNPQAVFLFPEFFKTLPSREVRSGFAEIIKHSLIADSRQWNKLSAIQDLESVEWMDYLHDSLLVKKRIVEIDPFEHGLRKALNFGHTVGHAVESYFLSTDEPLLHGEAIAIGMICESFLSHKIVGLPLESLNKITAFLLATYGFVKVPESELPYLFNIMQKDKKNENDQINFSLLPEIGEVKVNQIANLDLIVESIRFYNKLGNL